MSSSQLPNYLRSNRKRLTLSQEEIAFLLGIVSGGAKVSLHERFAQEPNLKTAFAYEAVFQRTASELFSGVYQKVEREVTARAKVLIARIDSQKPNRKTTYKRLMLMKIAGIERAISPKKP